ncbi:phosphoenolpyruvate carboxykinase (ATP) [Arachidicoccus ginsenosidimutans]|uniref:phosphoenolpyruvate carboxykinase (ATP) n=1 Tax=Arachidicoccus sp. BS20 TaxID=1850526 RepID=UPI0007F0B735|nr:phosphoenolpyruvate carboxykinase (ATP) [Arachidicoccus sp. BS20]ANI88579.1 phosphoenolpyruvate carboxykinase (ATP) [Arachidicoccus sp. BS20]
MQTVMESLENALQLEAAKIHYQLPSGKLTEQTLALGQGSLSDAGALCVNTGKFTGRSPKDRFIVMDDITKNAVDWGEVNIPFASKAFDRLCDKVCGYLSGKEIWVRDAFACSNEKYRMNIRVVTETPWANLFCHNLFLRPEPEELPFEKTDWLIIHAPGFSANPLADCTRQENFTILNFTRKIILIGGTAYTGEIKKGVFSVLNFILPHYHKVLSMHCSANEGKRKDVALFFGLSGTGKTTLSADPQRKLIGDDEHGWAEGSVFNFEGGCYAKCVNLSEEKEPQIFHAVRKGTLLENTVFFANSNRVDFDNISLTENTRAAYPIDFIPNAKTLSAGNNPKNIFFLTCDAFGVLPPISKLSKGQAMYHYVSGYTAKIAGTEIGINEPQPVFSACFGKVFLPLNPVAYAELLGGLLEKHPDINVWLINTGWSGGGYGVGKRISLRYTRAMMNAALDGSLNDVAYQPHAHFGVQIPKSVPGVPAEILHPRELWEDKDLYDEAANRLAQLFISNFEQYAAKAGRETRAGAPVISDTIIS